MFSTHRHRLNTPAYVRFAKIVPLIAIVAGIGFVISISPQIEDTQTISYASRGVTAAIGVDLVGVTYSRAGQR